MTDPMDGMWERPEQTNGDIEREFTYAGVGRALSHWENLEFSLSYTYSLFAGAHGKLALIQEYGAKGRIFEERLTVLEKTAGKYFVNRPHQTVEGEFSWICFAARQLAKRRNEIAHGIVDALHLDIENEAEKAEQAEGDYQYTLHPRYFAMPPHHQYLKYEDPGQYYYCSQNLKHFADTFERLRVRVSRFTEALL